LHSEKGPPALNLPEHNVLYPEGPGDRHHRTEDFEMSPRAAIGAVTAWLVMTAPASALDFPVDTDKVAHFGVSYIITDQLIRSGLTREQAVGTTLFVGWLKEVIDEHPDGYDLAADTAGALAAAYVRVEWRF
jgi:hypothetical protein